MSTSAASGAAHTGLVELRSYQLQPEGIKVIVAARRSVAALQSTTAPPPPPQLCVRVQWCSMLAPVWCACHT